MGARTLEKAQLVRKMAPAVVKLEVVVAGSRDLAMPERRAAKGEQEVEKQPALCHPNQIKGMSPGQTTREG